MTTNVERQPHEFRPSKLEGVLASIKNLSAEKIDLVVQRLRTPMQLKERDVETFFLRFWRLAEGQVSLQEIPMTADELAALGIAILTRADSLEKRALPEPAEPKAYQFEADAGTWRSSPYTRILVRPEPDGRYRGVVRHNRNNGDTGAFDTAAEAVAEAAKIVAAFEKTKEPADDTPAAEQDNATSPGQEKETNPNG